MDKAREVREAAARREAEEREEIRYRRMVAEMEELGRQVRVEAQEAAFRKIYSTSASAFGKAEGSGAQAQEKEFPFRWRKIQSGVQYHYS